MRIVMCTPSSAVPRRRGNAKRIMRVVFAARHRRRNDCDH